ncbi:MAG: hypothetical protein NZM38_07540 [Cytophagales bacterium]|nr:hypothetical protein [Cytophagales bacterium]MDW8384610.1 hypothetical protein [Flammeovirgaceae bacterium]
MKTIVFLFSALLWSSLLQAAIPAKEIQHQSLQSESVHSQNPKIVLSSPENFSKKEQKIKRILEHRAPQGVTVEDIVAFVGVIIMVIGAVSLIFNVWGGLVTIIVGLAIYLVGRALGGKVSRFFN